VSDAALTDDSAAETLDHIDNTTRSPCASRQIRQPMSASSPKAGTETALRRLAARRDTVRFRFFAARLLWKTPRRIKSEFWRWCPWRECDNPTISIGSHSQPLKNLPLNYISYQTVFPTLAKSLSIMHSAQMVERGSLFASGGLIPSRRFCCSDRRAFLSHGRGRRFNPYSAHH
jgi:hypothetical protein